MSTPRKRRTGFVPAVIFRLGGAWPVAIPACVAGCQAGPLVAGDARWDNSIRPFDIADPREPDDLAVPEPDVAWGPRRDNSVGPFDMALPDPDPADLAVPRHDNAAPRYDLPRPMAGAVAVAGAFDLRPRDLAGDGPRDAGAADLRDGGGSDGAKG